jgi:hypothetical protein
MCREEAQHQNNDEVVLHAGAPAETRDHGQTPAEHPQDEEYHTGLGPGKVRLDEEKDHGRIEYADPCDKMYDGIESGQGQIHGKGNEKDEIQDPKSHHTPLCLIFRDHISVDQTKETHFLPLGKSKNQMPQTEEPNAASEKPHPTLPARRSSSAGR